MKGTRSANCSKPSSPPCPHVRFRLSSIEATEIDDRIARLLIEEPRRLAPYLHAPLQSGSNRVLRRMGRHWYTAESYRARLEWLAERLPVFGLGADVIAGFPGETDADHQDHGGADPGAAVHRAARVSL